MRKPFIVVFLIVCAGFWVMGNPEFAAVLVGVLLRALFPRSTSLKVRLLAVIVIAVVQLPEILISARGPFSVLAETMADWNSLSVTHPVALVLWFFSNVGMPFILAAAGVDITDGLKKKGIPNHPSEDIVAKRAESSR